MRILSVIAALGLVGCVGGIEGPGEPGQPLPDNPTNPAAAAEAKKQYEDNVYSIVAAKCIGCHASAGPVGNATGFVGPSKDGSHVIVKGYTAAMGDLTIGGSPIVTKITDGAKTPSHAALTYTPDELAKFTAWLEKELAAKVPGGSGEPEPGGESPALATARVMKEWSGCQSLELFTAANMTAWGNMQADGSACRTCHGEGVYGFIASNQAEPNFFKYITEDKYFMLQYFSVDLSGGPAAAKIVINTRSFDAVGRGVPPHESHPRFNPTNNNGMTALQKYYDDVMARKAAGTCDPARLLN